LKDIGEGNIIIHFGSWRGTLQVSFDPTAVSSSRIELSARFSKVMNSIKPKLMLSIIVFSEGRSMFGTAFF
jgi:hypothetical protein